MHKKTILIADDGPHMRAALRKRLTTMGYEVIEAADGLNGLNQSPEGCVDLIILNHGMPDGDGRAMARVIRNRTDVPIVFMSGQDREEFRSLVTSMPDVYYLPKPLDHIKLEALLESLLPLHDLAVV